MLLNLAKQIFVLLLCGLAVNAVAHRYFFSMTDLTLNERTQSIEVIHQITAHDIDNAIAESKQIHFSIAHPDYENIIRQYIEENFQLYYQGQAIPLNWIGFEVNKGKIFLYQEAAFDHSLIGLKIINSLLTKRYPQQVNTVNFYSTRIKGSLTFNKSVTMHHIKIND
ncbi:hypothetical protein H4J51_12455 [Colwellia sp. MB02u-18]|uniref:DUF6702 family protein n=1 Tax=unclassified Colwellia TaxID=196834 RepID=UPI0015F3B55A|nr:MULTISPECIES: DUF6702 family protein [unclassified Colwellia]MBA6223436.1 hypothetical protein [Colwellia sp. MB3u-45]MBA6267961.1 hypothetical protein [Colwellia sp. MB3u-43]MBA6321620.1 hypothetical protein [Colwellia sp. MB02u-19]MBA6325381.1 hypothetical protein [Colwellia sp. MB02u-18]MBA6330048.1 hypothetical protein [Colwellia sp. MB02u-12]